MEGIEAFVLELSNYVGKEIGGACFSEDGSLPVTEVTLGRYRYNSYNSTQNHGLAIWANYHNRLPKSGLAGIFHTHPYYDGRDKPSRKDLNVRNNYLKEVPTMVFYIITYPVYYGDQTPYKFPYTYWAY